MPSIISKAKSLFRRSSKSSIISDDGPVGALTCSEDTDMAVASVTAQEDTQNKAEDTAVTCEPESIPQSEDTQPQSVKPVESKPKNREIKVRDFAYEPFPQSKKATKVWNPCRPLAIFDWCMVWNKEIDLYLDAMDLHKLVRIDWLTMADIHGWPGNEELYSRVPQEHVDNEYHWTHVKVEKPSMTERIVCARESIFSPLLFIRYPRLPNVLTKKNQEPVQEPLSRDHTSVSENDENKPHSAATVISENVSTEEESRGRALSPISGDARAPEVWPNKLRRKREESTDTAEKPFRKRVRIYGCETPFFEPSYPPHSNNHPTLNPIPSSSFNAPEFVTSSSFETPLPSYTVVNSTTPSSPSDSESSNLTGTRSSDLPANSLERYRCNLGLESKHFYEIGFAMPEDEPMKVSPSKKRRAEDTELPTSQPKRHRVNQSAIQNDMAEYAVNLGNADTGPSTSANTSDTHSTSLKYIRYQAKSDNKDTRKSVLPTPSPYGIGAQPLRRHDTCIGSGRLPLLSSYPFNLPTRRMWELLDDTPTWKFEMHGYAFDDYLKVPTPAKDVPSASIQEVTEDESNKSEGSEAGPSKS